jgi:hypothetical protein
VSRVSFARVSGAPPPARELLSIEDDGSWTAWRSTGRAAGRFAGPAGTNGPGARIIALAAAAADSPDPGPPPNAPVDTTMDHVTVDGRSVTIGYRAVPEGPWGQLLEALRGLLKEAIEHPVAAIALAIAGPDVLRLEHRGTEPLNVDLTGASAEGTVWTESGEYLTRGLGRLDAGPIEASPGWTAMVPLEGLEPDKPGNLVATMALAAEDGGELVPVRLSAGRAPG